MQIFIKDRKTFDTKMHAAALDFDEIRSIYDEYSTFVIPATTANVKENDIIYSDDGFFGIITNIEPEEKKITLSVSQIVNIFSRKLFYEKIEFQYLENRIRDLIYSNFINCEDDLYSLPYLQANAITQTKSNLQPDLDNGIFSIKSYAAKARRVAGVHLQWGITRENLIVDIKRKNAPVKNIDFSNPNYILQSEDFSSKTVSKVTTKAEDNGKERDWYLTENGSVSSVKPSKRLYGEWELLMVAEDANAKDSAVDEFARNTYSHKIVFLSKTPFDLYEPIRVSLRGKIFRSYISGVRKIKNSKLLEISCGELQTEYPYKNLV